MKHVLLLISLSTMGISCTGGRISTEIEANRLRANLTFLASDELEGREAGTRGEQLAARYIASQLQQYGVRPYALNPGQADSISYFQKFEATKLTVASGSGITIYDSVSHATSRLTYGDHFSNFHDQVTSCNFSAPMVFAGFGISAPEFNYDDYAGLDVKGKIVLVLDGEPVSDDENYFYGAIPSSYASAQFYKRHRARELGARAIIVIAYEKLLAQWDDYIGYFKAGKLYFDAAETSADSTDRIPFFYANEKLFQQLLTKSPNSYEMIREKVKAKETVPRFQLAGTRADMNVDRSARIVHAMNIIGLIEGQDPILKKEIVAIGAHFDHLGIDEHGVIYHGADDDGSGTVTVLETARTIAQSKSNKRSILVVFHAAEEKGLVGSKYLTDPDTRNSFSWKQVVGQVNIDMVGRESADSIYVIGSGRLSRELKTMIEKINSEKKLFQFDYTFDRDDDPNQYYFRSDHYNYAKLGIPIVFFFDGMTSDYHKPGDDVEKINFLKMEKIGRLVRELVTRIANLDHRLIIDSH